MWKILLTLFILCVIFPQASIAYPLKDSLNRRQTADSENKTRKLIAITATADTASIPFLTQYIKTAEHLKRTGLVAELLVARGRARLKKGDTTGALADVKLSETYMPLLASKAALSLKNKTIAFYVDWVKLNTPSNRGRLTYQSAQIKGLISVLNIKTLSAGREREFFSNAAKLATLVKNDNFYLYAKTGFAETLLKGREPARAVEVLDSLSDVPLLTGFEKMHILSLLVINMVKLDIQKNLDTYYNQLQALNKTSSGKLNQQEYLLASAMYLDKAKDYPQAFAKYRALLYRRGEIGNNNEFLVEGMIGLASLWGKLQKPDSATYYFNKAHQLIKDNGGFNGASVWYKLALSAYQKQQGKTVFTSDTVYRAQLANTTQQLQNKYRIELQSQKLKLLSQQQQLAVLTFTRDRQRSLIIILSLSVLLIVAGGFSNNLFQWRKQMLLLHAAEVENMAQAHQIEVRAVLAKAQEEERNRIAGQLHDEVGTMLAVARLNLSVIDDSMDNTTSISQQQLKTTYHILGDLATTIREMSHELMPLAIRQLGFKKSILQLIDDINASKKIVVDCIIVGLDEDYKYPHEFQTNVYRIIQELFQNLIKHSLATSAEFQLVEHPDELNMVIEDNGKGIDMKAYINGKGAQLLASRVDLCNGKITIEAGINCGTLIIIYIPVQNVVYSGLKNDPEYSETLPG